MGQKSVPGLALAAHGLSSCVIAALVIILHESLLPDLGTRPADALMVTLLIAWLGTILFVGGLVWGWFAPPPVAPRAATTWVDGLRAWSRGRGYPAFALARFGVIAGALTAVVMVVHGSNVLGTQADQSALYLMLGAYAGLLVAMGSLTTAKLRALWHRPTA